MSHTWQVGRAVLASNLELDAPKHIFLMLFMLIDRKDPNSFFKVLTACNEVPITTHTRQPLLHELTSLVMSVTPAPPPPSSSPTTTSYQLH